MTSTTTGTPETTPVPSSLRSLRVTVRDGLTGVNRVIGLVRHRGTAPQALTARLTDEPDTWLVEHDFIATSEMTALLVRQLERLPCVLTVEH